MSYIGNQPSQVAFLTDQFSGNGSTTAFTMSVAPANPASVLIAISGVLQDPSTYAVSGTTLTFTGAPPAGTANISARYLGIPASGVTTTAYRTVTEITATAGQTTFSPPSYTAGFINVYRNGVRLASTDYTATNGTTVVLTVGANLYDIVTIESYYVSSVLNAIPATAGSVTQTYVGSIYQTAGAAFAAWASNAQALTSNVFTKIQFNTEVFDTNNCFDNTTNYRFTPNVAGYYQVNGLIPFTLSSGSTNATQLLISLYKNGSEYLRGNNSAMTDAYTTQTVSTVMYMNGTTDYIELYGYSYQGSGTSTAANGNSFSAPYFSAALVRGA